MSGPNMALTLYPACDQLCTPQDFYSKDCWSHHPKPYGDFIEFKKKEFEALEAERKKAIRV